MDNFFAGMILFVFAFFVSLLLPEKNKKNLSCMTDKEINKKIAQNKERMERNRK